MTPRSLLAPAALGAAILFGAPAQADPRIATHFYQASEVVTIHGRGGTQSTVVFAPDERIENVAVGDSAGWQVIPNKRADLLFLKPTKASARTNMTVVTDQRTYLFDLDAGPHAAPLYMLRFTYPAAPRPAPAPAPVADAAIAVAVVAKPAAPDPATLNFAWASRGDKALMPSRVFDDGHSTYLAWPKDMPLPAILTSEGKGAEGPVNYTTQGEYVVVDGVPAQLILRAGKQMVTLTSVPDGKLAKAERRHKAPPVIQRTPYALVVSAGQ
jgi:type IV secretion system protein VirB9